MFTLFLTLFFIALSLSFDSFAVAISCGIIVKNIKFLTAFRIALSFAFFQALFLATGCIIGYNVKNYIENFDHWIAFILLFIIGFKMILESFKSYNHKSFNPLLFKTTVMLSVATSIDALIVGIGFALILNNIFYAVFITGAVTLLAAMLGMLFGKKLGYKIGNSAEMTGGIILILIGLKILFQHIFN